MLSGENGSIKIVLLLFLTFVIIMGGMLFLTGSLKKKNLPKLPLIGQFFPGKGKEETVGEGEKPSEVDRMVAELKKQEEEYKHRKETLDERELRLNQLEKEIEGREEKLAKIRDEITGSVVKMKAGERKNLKRLAKVYEAMRPEDAALIVEKLSDKVVINILYLMKEKKSAGILEELAKSGNEGVERAARLSELMRKLSVGGE